MIRTWKKIGAGMILCIFMAGCGSQNEVYLETEVSQDTGNPQETEEPEEEPIVDNSADYSVAFEDDGSGSSAWYLHDNTMGTRYQVSDLLNAEETNKNNQATIDQTAKSMRFVVILMAFVIVVLIIVVTILIIKVRSTYEDYDDYDDDEEDDGNCGRFA